MDIHFGFPMKTEKTENPGGGAINQKNRTLALISDCVPGPPGAAGWLESCRCWRAFMASNNGFDGPGPTPPPYRKDPPPHAQVPRGGVLRAVTCLILPVFPSFFLVAQAPRGGGGSLGCHMPQQGCLRKGGGGVIGGPPGAKLGSS